MLAITFLVNKIRRMLKLLIKYKFSIIGIAINELNSIILNFFLKHKIERIYGKFETGIYFTHQFNNVSNESGHIKGEIVWIIRKLNIENAIVLLVGETNKVKTNFLENFPFRSLNTTGISDNVDYHWDFNDQIPVGIGKYNLILSQAVLEHLVDPVDHIRKLKLLLADNGYLIVHTVMPGFFYHRYPVDCLRFYPDWFQEISKLVKLQIKFKILSLDHIIYCYQHSNL